MSDRVVGRLAIGLWLAAIVLTIVSAVLQYLDRSTWWSSGFSNFQNVFAIHALSLSYATVGVLVVTRLPRNRIGWLVLAAGLVTAAAVFLSEYAVHTYVVAPGSLPTNSALAVIQGDIFFPAVFPYGLGLLLFLFPNGEPPSRRWWPIFWVATVDAVFVFVVGLFTGGEVTSSFRSVDLHLQNPYALIPEYLYNGFPGGLPWMLQLVWMLIAAVSVVIRMRRSTGVERQQVKWLAYVGALSVIGFLLGVLPLPVPSIGHVGNNVLFTVGVLGASIGIPAAMGIAILRYRLYEIDVVISRTVLYAFMAAFIAAVYVAIVAGIGYLFGGGARPSLALSIVATAVVALAFQPVRDRAERLANRLVFGRQLTPYEVLSRFSDEVAVLGRADILTEIAKAVTEGIGASSASVWVTENSHLVPKAGWPRESAQTTARDRADRFIEVQHLGETLGAIAVAKPRGETLTPLEEGLLQDLAAQAGPVIHNVALNRELSHRLEELSAQELELRRSRQRIVAAQDAERRRLERNIHDGAQQHLVALAVKLNLAKAFAAKDTARAVALLDELEAETGEAEATLDALSRGIYPQLLTDHGLEPALHQESRTLGLDCRITTRDLRRYDIDVEGAVYFCCLEALQNAAKHARDSVVEVVLEESGGELQFSVRDRGPGFDEAKVRAGSGLKNMRDRIEALGGYVQVFSRPGQGAWVVGRVPVRVGEVVA